MSDAPERITALDLKTKPGCRLWSTTRFPNEHTDVEYVRADKIAALAAENKRLREIAKMGCKCRYGTWPIPGGTGVGRVKCRVCEELAALEEEGDDG